MARRRNQTVARLRDALTQRGAGRRRCLQLRLWPHTTFDHYSARRTRRITQVQRSPRKRKPRHLCKQASRKTPGQRAYSRRFEAYTSATPAQPCSTVRQQQPCTDHCSWPSPHMIHRMLASKQGYTGHHVGLPTGSDRVQVGRQLQLGHHDD